MTQRNKGWFFKQNPFTQDLSPKEMEFLDAVSETHTFRKRQFVWKTGDPSDRVFFIRSGMIKVSRVTDDGREITLHLIQRNEILGEMALVSLGPQSSVAEAYDESVLYSISTKDFLTVMQANTRLFLQVTRLISERRRALENRVEDLLFKTAHARLASLFLELADRFGVRDSRGVIINLKLTHREMASLIGASRETVSFAILDLRKDGLVLTEDKRVILLDDQRLKTLAVT